MPHASQSHRDAWDTADVPPPQSPATSTPKTRLFPRENQTITSPTLLDQQPAVRPPEQARKPPLPALSGLRTILAVNIMFFHFTPPLPAWLHPVVDNAYVFVGFFFLISGFILAYNYADRPRLSLRSFYVARLSRVYPVYLLVLLLSLPFLRAEWLAHTRGDFYLGLLLTPFALQGWSPALADLLEHCRLDPAGGTLPLRRLSVSRTPANRTVSPTADRLAPGRADPGFLGHRLYPAPDLPGAEPGSPARTRHALHLRLLAASPQVHAARVSVELFRRHSAGAPARPAAAQHAATKPGCPSLH